jgi:hypothetical protein
VTSENQPPSNAGLPVFDFTLVGDANLDVLLYGVPEDLPVERELLAGGMAIRLGARVQPRLTTWRRWGTLSGSFRILPMMIQEDFAAMNLHRRRSIFLDVCSGQAFRQV